MLQTVVERQKVAVAKGHHAVRMGAQTTIKKTLTFGDSFKSFIERSDVVDVAVAFVMGLAAREIVTALSTDIFGYFCNRPLTKAKSDYTVALAYKRKCLRSLYRREGATWDAV